MKTFIAALTAVVIATPALATSLRHPYDYSVEELNAVLSNKEVVAKVSKHFEGITSLERTKAGWELKTDHCRLEVTVKYVSVPNPNPVPRPRPLPVPPFPTTISKRELTVGDCR